MLTSTIYQTVTITQVANTTCVYDYYERLALGAHLFSGSSLHSNLWQPIPDLERHRSEGLSLPVNQIQPQELSKDMSATQGTDHVWNITKTAPDSLSFGRRPAPTSRRT